MWNWSDKSSEKNTQLNSKKMDETIVLYKLDISPCCRAVSIVARLIGLEHEEKIIDLFKGDQMIPDNLQRNPEHTVPTIDDNGKIMWESHAIVTYLVDKYAKNDDLYPKDLYLRAKCNQRLFFDVSILYNCLDNCSQYIFMGGYDIPQNYLESILEAYDLLESTLNDDLYLVGDRLTVADICAMTSITSLDDIYIPIDSVKYPRITSWLGRIKVLNFYDRKNGQFVDIYKHLLNKKLNENREKHLK